MKFNKRAALYSLALCVIFFMSLLFVFFPGEDLSIHIDGVFPLNDRWDYTSGAAAAADIALPAKLDAQKNEPFMISRTLGADFARERTIGFRSSLQAVRVRVDNEEIYRRDFQTRTSVRIPIASMWHIIKLPENSQNKLLTIEYTSPYQRCSGYITPVVYGSKSGVLFSIFLRYGPGFFVGAVVFLFGTFFVLISLVVKSMRNPSLLYIGLFAVFVSFWLLAESKMLQFFTGNQFLLGGGAFMSLSLFPVPLLLYVRETVATRFRQVYGWFSALLILNLFVITFLQISGIADYFETIAITHTIIVAAMLTGIFLTAVEIIRYKNEGAVKFLISISVLFAFSAAEFIGFYTGDYYGTSAYLRIGFITYISIIGIGSMKQLQEAISQSNEARFYESIANMDILTGGKNRYAFDNDMIKYDSDSACSHNMRLVIMDLNDLKHINDHYGHKEGDEAIKASFDCIRKAFGHLGECYRIGGDEFACIIENSGVDEYVAALKNCHELIDNVNQSRKYPLSIAVGQATCGDLDESSRRGLFECADDNMYRNKKRVKRDYIGAPGRDKDE